MIRKQDILDRAAEWQLRAEVVEKDYVLGWLLAGLAQTPMAEAWVFKGGTCIKKCYFETYRFSEDLDFSLQPDAAYTQEALTRALRDLAARVSELSGLEFQPDLIDVKPRRNQQGQVTYEGRLAYRGPLAYPGTPKIRFDLTRHEAVIDAAASRPILHPYPDELPDGTRVRTYHGVHRLVEPYAIRQAQTGHVLLYGWELAAGQIKAFKLAEMDNVRTTGSSFSPRYQVEISSTGPLTVPMTSQVARSVTRRPASGGPTYVFECGACGKHFSRKTNDPMLRKHKRPDGWDCPGRRGFMVNTLY